MLSSFLPCLPALSPSPLPKNQVLDGDLEAFVSKVSWELSNSRNKAIKAVVSPLALLLRSERARLVFGEHGGVGYLTKLLKLQGSHGNAQLLYELAFCIWTLTFHEDLKQGASVRPSVIRLCLHDRPPNHHIAVPQQSSSRTARCRCWRSRCRRRRARR